MEILSLIIFFIYIAYLVYEKSYNDKCVSSFKYIIHVNGIRGKTSVARLIDAGLREEGYKVFTKTTGTVPIIIDTENKEYEIKRKGSINIKEQLSVIKKAYLQKAEILILECMAINPQLQKVCQNDIVKSNISIITNVRHDHVMEMGFELDDIAQSLSNTIPENGVFFTGESKYFNKYKTICESKNTKAILCKDSNEEIAYKVCEYIGVNNEDIFDRFKKHKKDFGSHELYNVLNNKNETIFFLNLFSVNDPESTMNIYKNINIEKYSKVYFLYNNRYDRPNRVMLFAKYFFNNINCDGIFIIGKNKHLARIIIRSNKIDNCKLINRFDELFTLEKNSLIVGIGNIKGQGWEILKLLEAGKAV